MKPISNFRGHPTLKYGEQKTLIVTEESNNPELYLITNREAALITPEKVSFTNIGEPYQELLRFEFSYDKYWLHGDGYGSTDSIDLDSSDLVELEEMLKIIEYFLLPTKNSFLVINSKWERELPPLELQYP